MKCPTLFSIAIAVSISVGLTGCDLLVDALVDQILPYDLTISAPDTIHAESLPVSPRFTVRLKQLGLPVSCAVIRVQDRYFETDYCGEADCYQRFYDYGPNQLKVEALDSVDAYFAMASAEKQIFIAP